MRGHNGNELKYQANIVAPDGVTVLLTGIGAGVTDLAGRRLEAAQLIAAETSHMLLVRFQDVMGYLTPACYIVCDGVTYIVDYPVDPRIPRPNMWLELYCHVERVNS